MTPLGDPYRVLGLVPGASVGEIRSAYRRLAKLHHPDTAGERSLGRFLAVQAAYEALVDGEGRLRTRGWPARAGTGTTRAPNPGAKGASRDAWRARQAAGSSGGGPTGEGAAGANGARPGSAGARSGPAGASPRDRGAGGSAPGGANGGGGPRSSSRAKAADRRTAKPGSTTYDEAAQPLDPSWEGAEWYGASSGRYWTLNPREYADPRKHGPEYQERARRAARLEAQRRARAARAAAGAGAGLPPAPSADAIDEEPAPDEAEPAG